MRIVGFLSRPNQLACMSSVPPASAALPPDQSKADVLTAGGVAPALSNGAVVWRLLKLTWRYRWNCLLLLIMQLLLMGLSVSMVQFGGYGIDLIRFHTGQMTELPVFSRLATVPTSYSPLAQVGLAAAGMAIMALLRTAMNVAYALVSGHLVHRRIVVDLRAEVYAKLQRLSLRFYDQQATGSIINRVTGDVQSTRTFIDGVLIQLSVLAMTLVVYLYFLFQIHVWLTLCCLATTPIVWWMSIRFSRQVRPMYDASRTRADEMVLRVAEAADGVLVIKSLGRQQAEIDQFAQANDRLRDQQQQVFLKVSMFSPIVQLLTQVNLVILLIYGGYLVSIDQLPLGTGMIVFAGLLQQFSNQVSNLSGLAGTIQQSLTGVRACSKYSMQRRRFVSHRSLGFRERFMAKFVWTGCGLNTKRTLPCCKISRCICNLANGLACWVVSDMESRRC